MFDNVGDTIKSVAKIMLFLEVIGAIIWSMSLFNQFGFSMIGLIVLFGGIAVAWLSSLFMYGFGQLIENTDALVGKQNTYRAGKQGTLSSSTGDYLKKAGEKKTIKSNHKCPYCGDVVKDGRCEMCGKEVKF